MYIKFISHTISFADFFYLSQQIYVMFCIQHGSIIISHCTRARNIISVFVTTWTLSSWVTSNYVYVIYFQSISISKFAIKTLTIWSWKDPWKVLSSDQNLQEPSSQVHLHEAMAYWWWCFRRLIKQAVSGRHQKSPPYLRSEHIILDLCR